MRPWGGHPLHSPSPGASLSCPIPYSKRPLPERPTARLPHARRPNGKHSRQRGECHGQRAREHHGAGGPGTPWRCGAPRGPVMLRCPFSAGPCPIETSGTRSHFAVTDVPEEAAWSAVVQEQEGDSVSVSLCSPPDARIGRYSLTVEISTGYEGSSSYIGHFVLLFNAWHPGEAFPLF